MNIRPKCLHTKCNMKYGLISSVLYKVGRGEFSLAGPRPYTRPGGYVSRNPRPAPVRGPRPFMPCTGPCLLPPIFNGDPSRVGVVGGLSRDRGQECQYDTTPHAIEWGGAAKTARGPSFLEPVRPVTNSSDPF